MSEIVALTRDYESWLGRQIDLVEPDLRAKHVELASSPLRFLRGTYYYWLRRVPVLCPGLLDAPAVCLVGDLHAENFGSWRDRKGVRRWGINDLDELGQGPYPIDLVRLATSCVLIGHFALPTAELCDLLLAVWMTATPARAVKLDEASHLQHLLPDAEGSAFYATLARGEAVAPDLIPDGVRAAVAGTVVPAHHRPWTPSWHRRRAGTGSLGHPRFAAVDGDVAREVKQLGPATASWAGLKGWQPGAGLYLQVSEALRGPSPAIRVAGWQVRALSPDAVRIDIASLHPRHAERVVQSMAQALVDVHGVNRAELLAARADAAARPDGWLAAAVEAMAADTCEAYADWRARTA